jgi:YgiT-type zinc finger domain-containing protein
MICDLCGKKSTRQRRVTRCLGRGRSTLLIENIPLVVCSSCGAGYFTAETLREIERIRRHWPHLAVERSLPVARFGDDVRTSARRKSGSHRP